MYQTIHFPNYDAAANLAQAIRFAGSFFGDIKARVIPDEYAVEIEAKFVVTQS